MLIWPIDALGLIIANGQEAMTAADRVYEVLDTEPTIVDRPGATAARDRGRARRGAVRGGRGSPIPAAPAPILRGVDLEIQPGETLAIVGATGSRQDDAGVAGAPADRRRPPAGSRSTATTSATSRSPRCAAVVGVAFEEATLFSMSVRENLTLGRPDATDAGDR